MKSLTRAFLWLAFAAPCVLASNLPAPDADDGGIRLQNGFRALVVADHLVDRGPDGKRHDALRFLTVAPNGDLYANTASGDLIALRDTNGDGRADLIKRFGSGGGTGIVYREGWLYYSTTSAVYRYRMTPGELLPAGEPELIVRDLPSERQHDAKNFAFDDQGRLLVEVGSPSNSFGNPDRQLGAKGGDPTEFLKTHGGFWRFDPEKPGQTQADGFHFSTGHRHSLSLAWNPTARKFFMVMMGRDQLNTVAPQYYDALDNAERVAEELHLLREGTNLGWPYTYYDPTRKARMVAPEYGGDNHREDLSPRWDKPLVAFPAHWAPMQMAFYQGSQFPERYRGGAFIAFHGSWNRAPMPQAGYKVCFVPFDAKGMPLGSYEVFADGFQGFGPDGLNLREPAYYRPCGLAIGPDGSLYIGDSEKGRIWRVIYTWQSGSSASRPAALPVATAAVGEDSSRGASLYRSICATCHMQDGSGVSGMQPPLAGSPVVSGDVNRLIRVVLQGPAAVLPPERAKYQNTMPAFSFLDDASVAELLSYLRKQFGTGASAVQPAQVSEIRRAKP